MKVRFANFDDIEEVVGIHIQAFPDFFLTFLGPRFLYRFYSGFLRYPSGILLIAENGEGISGFAAGTVRPEIFFPALRKGQALPLLIAALPGLLRRPLPVFRKLLRAAFYRGEKPSRLEGAALLSSIGVRPEMHGRQVGLAILNRFEEAASMDGAKCVYLTTDQSQNERAIAFYGKCGYQKESSFLREPGRLMWRYVKKIDSASYKEQGATK